MSHPEAVSSAICCSVVSTSAVRVVVIDCTEIGASPPTRTEPTLICRVGRRGASTGGGVGHAGHPLRHVQQRLTGALGVVPERRRDVAGVLALTGLVGSDAQESH